MSRGLRFIAGVAAIIAAPFTGGASMLFFSTGVTLALGAAFEKKPRAFSNFATGMSVVLRSATEAQPCLYGRAKKSGVLSWTAASGNQRESLWVVIAIADGREIDSYLKLWLDDIEIDLATQMDANGFVTLPEFIDADGKKLLQAGFYTGTADQVADPDLLAAFPELTESFRGQGTAYFWLRMEYDQSEGGANATDTKARTWHAGVPGEMAVEFRGFKIYDPRKDSTAGGSGTHRRDDPATWEWSDNAILCARDYLVEKRLGPGLSPALFPAASIAANASICDELVTVPVEGGSSEPQKRYTLNGVVRTDGVPQDIVRGMLTACQGTFVHAPGDYRLLAGAWSVPAHDFDETWLAGPISAPSSTPWRQLYNYVRGKYVSEAAGWQLVDLKPLEVPAFEAADGGDRAARDMDLEWTTDGREGQRIQLIEAKRGRNQLVVQMRCNGKAAVVSLWETCTLTLAEWGFDKKTFRIVEDTRVLEAAGSEDDDRPTWLYDLVLREEEADDWTYALPDIDEVLFEGAVDSGLGRPPPCTNLTAVGIPSGVRLDWTLPDGLKQVEIFASETDDRPLTTANRVGWGLITSFTHPLAPGETRYYWLLSRGFNNLTQWNALGGVSATAQAPPAGENVTLYRLRFLDGKALKNGVGTLRVEARKTVGSSDTYLSTGNIQIYVGTTLVTAANGYAAGSDGYTGVFDAGDINGHAIVELKNGPTGELLDSDTIVDVADGEATVIGICEPDPQEQWIQDKNSGAWSPAGTTSDFDFTFFLSGAEVARVARRVTLNTSAGTLTAATVAHKGGDLNISRVSFVITGSGTPNLTITATYSFGGFTYTVPQSVAAIRGGDQGDDGRPGHSLAANPFFEEGDVKWAKGTGWTIEPIAVAQGMQGDWCARWAGSSEATITNDVQYAFDAAPGERYSFSAKIKKISNVSGTNVILQFLARSQDGTGLTVNNAIVLTPAEINAMTAPTQVFGIATLTTNALLSKANPRIRAVLTAGSFVVDEIIIKRVTELEDIPDYEAPPSVIASEGSNTDSNTLTVTHASKGDSLGIVVKARSVGTSAISNGGVTYILDYSLNGGTNYTTIRQWDDPFEEPTLTYTVVESPPSSGNYRHTARLADATQRVSPGFTGDILIRLRRTFWSPATDQTRELEIAVTELG